MSWMPCDVDPCDTSSQPDFNYISDFLGIQGHDN